MQAHDTIYDKKREPSNARLSYYLMLAAMLVRLSWLTVMEPRGASQAGANYPRPDTLAGFAARTLPYIVYPSIVILVAIVIGALLKKRWTYIGGVVFGAVHLALTLPLVMLSVNPGYGPLVVLPACVLMIVFSALTYRAGQVSTTALRAS
jgi:hypothetical protein